MSQDTSLGQSEWREELLGTIKQAVPMTTADARRVIDVVLDAVSAEYTILPKNAVEGFRLGDAVDPEEAWVDDHTGPVGF